MALAISEAVVARSIRFAAKRAITK
jgi:hypothetical protein